MEGKPGWTQEQHARIEKELNQMLGPEYLSVINAYSNSNLYVLDNFQASELADQIFGTRGWSVEEKWTSINYETANLVDNEELHEVSVCVCCRVVLLNGSFQEDIGNAVNTNASRSNAYSRAKRYAAQDATKRCLRKFGNALGNCLQDKEYNLFLNKLREQK